MYYGTNLAARNDGTTVGDVVGVYITLPGCNRKTPLVKLETVNKHCQEIARISKKIKKIKILKLIKARICCLDSMHPRVFLVANHFQVEIKTRGACDAREHENCTNGTLGEGTDSVGDTGFAHLALGVVK